MNVSVMQKHLRRKRSQYRITSDALKGLVNALVIAGYGTYYGWVTVGDSIGGTLCIGAPSNYYKLADCISKFFGDELPVDVDNILAHDDDLNEGVWNLVFSEFGGDFRLKTAFELPFHLHIEVVIADIPNPTDLRVVRSTAGDRTRRYRLEDDEGQLDLPLEG